MAADAARVVRRLIFIDLVIYASLKGRRHCDRARVAPARSDSEACRFGRLGRSRRSNLQSGDY